MITPGFDLKAKTYYEALKNDEYANIEKANMIPALEEYIEILFEDQKSCDDYKDLMDGLDDLAKNARKIEDSVGGVNTDEEFEEYHQYADDILDLLIEHLPALLKKEAFFKEVFYPDLP